jgi:hypothetical protein
MKMYAIDIWPEGHVLEYIITIAESKKEAVAAFVKKGYNITMSDKFEEYEVGDVFYCQYDG